MKWTIAPLALLLGSFGAFEAHLASNSREPLFETANFYEQEDELEWWKPVLFEKIKKLAGHVDKKAAHFLPKILGDGYYNGGDGKMKTKLGYEPAETYILKETSSPHTSHSITILSSPSESVTSYSSRPVTFYSSGRGLQSSGSYSSGLQSSGSYSSGLQPSGSYSSGLQSSGSYTSGLQPSGSYSSGLQPSGSYTSGLQPSGSYSSGLQPSGSYSSGLQPSGSYSSGLQPSGSYSSGLQSSGSNSGGISSSGSLTSGLRSPGSGGLQQGSRIYLTEGPNTGTTLDSSKTSLRSTGLSPAGTNNLLLSPQAHVASVPGPKPIFLSNSQMGVQNSSPREPSASPTGSSGTISFSTGSASPSVQSTADLIGFGSSSSNSKPTTSTSTSSSGNGLFAAGSSLESLGVTAPGLDRSKLPAPDLSSSDISLSGLISTFSGNVRHRPSGNGSDRGRVDLNSTADGQSGTSNNATTTTVNAVIRNTPIPGTTTLTSPLPQVGKDETRAEAVRVQPSEESVPFLGVLPIPSDLDNLWKTLRENETMLDEEDLKEEQDMEAEIQRMRLQIETLNEDNLEQEEEEEVEEENLGLLQRMRNFLIGTTGKSASSVPVVNSTTERASKSKPAEADQKLGRPRLFWPKSVGLDSSDGISSQSFANSQQAKDELPVAAVSGQGSVPSQLSSSGFPHFPDSVRGQLSQLSRSGEEGTAADAHPVGQITGAAVKAEGSREEEIEEGLLVYLVTDQRGMQFLLPSAVLPRLSTS